MTRIGSIAARKPARSSVRLETAARVMIRPEQIRTKGQQPATLLLTLRHKTVSDPAVPAEAGTHTSYRACRRDVDPGFRQGSEYHLFLF